MASVFHDKFRNAAEDDERVKQWAGYLERCYARRGRLKIPDARKPLARDLRVAPGTVERLSGGRVKGVRKWMHDRVCKLFVVAVQEEIKTLKHQLDIALQCGADPRGAHVAKIEAALTTARALLEAGA